MKRYGQVFLLAIGLTSTGRALGADGADCVHGRVPDAAMDGGAVANVCHRLDATDPHDHLAGLVADGTGDPGRAGGLPDRRASGGRLPFIPLSF